MNKQSEKAGRKAQARDRSGAKSSKRADRPNKSTVQTVRIIAAVVAAVAVILGVYLAVNAQGNFETGLIIGLLALGLIAALSLAAALRPAGVIRRVKRMTK